MWSFREEQAEKTVDRGICGEKWNNLDKTESFNWELRKKLFQPRIR